MKFKENLIVMVNENLITTGEFGLDGDYIGQAGVVYSYDPDVDARHPYCVLLGNANHEWFSAKELTLLGSVKPLKGAG